MRYCNLVIFASWSSSIANADNDDVLYWSPHEDIAI